MKMPTAEILPHIHKRDTDGNYATLVGRITDFKGYPNIGVLFVKKGDTSGVLFVTFSEDENMAYVENENDIAELEQLWETTKQIENIADRLGFN